jgi:RNA 2',3'-cyclic 3'-phosphodiesterase
VRLFVALELPSEVRSALGGWVRAAVATGGDGADARLRAVPEAGLHVTLCFLGEVESGAVGEVAQGMAEGVTAWSSSGRAGPVRLAVDGVVWLGPRRSRVCAVRLADPGGAGALAQLQAAVARRLVAGGRYAPERRPFLAHVTVARMRSGPAGPGGRAVPGVRPGRAGRVAAAPPPPVLAPFVAPAVVLYRSHPRGSYEPLARVALPAG